MAIIRASNEKGVEDPSALDLHDTSHLVQKKATAYSHLHSALFKEIQMPKVEVRTSNKKPSGG